jgi:hypothetical protein
MLDKDVARRYQSARELVTDLERVAASARPAEADRRCSPSKVVLLGLLVFLITACVWAIWTRVAQSGRGTLSLTPFTFYPGYEQNPAISPDGRQIAYVGQGIRGTNPLELYVQAIGSIDPVRLTRHSPGEENRSPAWDPLAARSRCCEPLPASDSREFFSHPPRGSEFRLRCRRRRGDGPFGLEPERQKARVHSPAGSRKGVIYQFSTKDRTLRQVSFPRPGQTDCCPEFDPDSRQLAFKRNEVEIVLIDERTGAARSLAARACWPG